MEKTWRFSRQPIMSQVGMETSTEGRSWALATNLQGVQRAMGHSWWPEN